MELRKDNRFSAEVRVAIILFILVSSMYMMLPKEVFDPHVGIGYDIYCIAYTLLSCVSIVAPEKLVCGIIAIIIIFDVVSSVEPAEVVSFWQIRAPPAFLSFVW
jgi:hypothetical protein